MTEQTEQTSRQAPPGPQAAGSRRPSRLPTLTGLRFPAALLVFLFHGSLPFTTIRLLAQDRVEHRFYTLVEYAGALGVTFFFVLSGFILTWSARPKDTARAFWRRRAVKIVPNYLIGWALAVGLIAWSGSTGGQKTLTFFMLQSWVPNVSTNFAVDAPGWSLSAEAFFYVCFPLLLPLILRIPARGLKYGIGAVVAAIAATPLLAYAIMPVGAATAANWPTDSANYFWFAYIFPPARLLDFVLGILVARAVQTGRWRNIGMPAATLLLIGGYALGYATPLLYSLRVVCVVPAAMLIAAGAIADDRGRFTLMRNRAATWLGEISFAFYLVQYVVLVYGRTLLGRRLFSSWAGFGLIAAEGVISLLLAWAMYALVERPLTRRWSKPRKAARTAAPLAESQRPAAPVAQ